MFAIQPRYPRYPDIGAAIRFPFRTCRQPVPATIVDGSVRGAHRIAQHPLAHLARALGELVAGRQSAPSREEVRERKGLEPCHAARWTIVARAISGPVRHEAAAIAKPEADPLALRELVLPNSECMCQRDLDGVILRLGASRLAPRRAHNEAAGLHRAPGRLRRLVQGRHFAIQVSKGFGLIERFSEDLDLKVEPGSVRSLPAVSTWKSEGCERASRSA